jgi:hypothetical protein
VERSSGSGDGQGRGLSPVSRLLCLVRAEQSGAGRHPMRGPWDVLSAAGGGVWSVTCQVFQAPAIYGFGLGPTRLAGILVSLSPSKTNIRTLTVTLRPIRFLGSVTRDDNLLRMSGTCGGVEQAIPHVSTTNQHGSQQTVGPGRRRRQNTKLVLVETARGPRCLHHILVLFNLAQTRALVLYSCNF